MNESTIHPRTAEHEVYLLRVWYEHDGERPVWRSSLLLPHDAHKRYFATPDALLAFLHARVDPAHLDTS